MLDRQITLERFRQTMLDSTPVALAGNFISKQIMKELNKSEKAELLEKRLANVRSISLEPEQQIDWIDISDIHIQDIMMQRWLELMRGSTYVRNPFR